MDYTAKKDESCALDRKSPKLCICFKGGILSSGLVDRGPSATAWEAESPLKAIMGASDLGICVRVVMAIKSAFGPSPWIKFVCQYRFFLFVPNLIHVSVLRLEQVDTDYWECPSWETGTLDGSTTKVEFFWKTQISFSIVYCLIFWHGLSIGKG